MFQYTVSKLSSKRDKRSKVTNQLANNKITLTRNSKKKNYSTMKKESKQMIESKGLATSPTSTSESTTSQHQMLEFTTDALFFCPPICYVVCIFPFLDIICILWVLSSECTCMCDPFRPFSDVVIMS